MLVDKLDIGYNFSRYDTDSWTDALWEKILIPRLAFLKKGLVGLGLGWSLTFYDLCT